MAFWFETQLVRVGGGKVSGWCPETNIEAVLRGLVMSVPSPGADTRIYWCPDNSHLNEEGWPMYAHLVGTYSGYQHQDVLDLAREDGTIPTDEEILARAWVLEPGWDSQELCRKLLKRGPFPEMGSPIESYREWYDGPWTPAPFRGCLREESRDYAPSDGVVRLGAFSGEIYAPLLRSVCRKIRVDVRETRRHLHAVNTQLAMEMGMRPWALAGWFTPLNTRRD